MTFVGPKQTVDRAPISEGSAEVIRYLRFRVRRLLLATVGSRFARSATCGAIRESTSKVLLHTAALFSVEDQSALCCLFQFFAATRLS
jgi:hypothetical protein